MGFTLAWQKAEEIMRLKVNISSYLFGFSVFVSLGLIIIYILKIIKHSKEAKKEYNHPIKINFYPIISKLFLLSSIICLSINTALSGYLWWTGVILQFTFTILIMTAWIRHDKFEIHHINPSWFIPVVGSIIVPIAGIKHFSAELSWFFFSIGFFWWLILTTLVMNRVVFHNPIPKKLIPTLFILFAPPIIGFIALTKLLGGLNLFGNLLFYFGLFMFILIMFQIRLFAKLPFYLSWWAYSFPLDALVIGTLLFYHESGIAFFGYISWILFILLNLTIIGLTIKTILEINRKNICIEETD